MNEKTPEHIVCEFFLNDLRQITVYRATCDSGVVVEFASAWGTFKLVKNAVWGFSPKDEPSKMLWGWDDREHVYPLHDSVLGELRLIVRDVVSGKRRDIPLLLIGESGLPSTDELHKYVRNAVGADENVVSLVTKLITNATPVRLPRLDPHKKVYLEVPLSPQDTLCVQGKWLAENLGETHILVTESEQSFEDEEQNGSGRFILSYLLPEDLTTITTNV